MQNNQEFLLSFRDELNALFTVQLTNLLDNYMSVAKHCETINTLPVITQERYWIATHKARDLELRATGHTRCTEQFLDVAAKIANELFKSQE